MLACAALALATIALPTLTVRVQVAKDVPSVLARYVLDEAAATWAASGITLTFSQESAAFNEVTYPGGVVIVTIDNDPPTKPGELVPLGWIPFDQHSQPQGRIHLSFSNAWTLLRDAKGAEALHLTLNERNRLLGRALGRALAHELGHYLLESKAHAPTGLMKTGRSSAEFFSERTDAFALPQEGRALIASQLFAAASRLAENTRALNHAGQQH
jgi:hypothetical protein